eukprot:gb/GECH01010275.1/.p1 GENE.gb/GECH01010275.1/~~gb/GECH01010275.1/.p1  ORF type:complete len:146 (+),score=25.98 gb/GECH01010275.1/:1-438(+)
MSTENKRTVLTCGTFDLLHVGHVKLLERAKKLANGGKLVVGLSSDEFTLQKKQRKPVYPYSERKIILESIRYVDKVFCEESLEDKARYIKEQGADLFVIGDDWKGRFDEELESICEVQYLPRTPEVSTTSTITGVGETYQQRQDS